MQSLEVLDVTNPILKQVSTTIENPNKETLELAFKMIETMKAERGIGLAAVQVGILKRILVAGIKGNTYDGGDEVFINPTILETRGELIQIEEGCLSVPNYFAPVPRHSEVDVSYIDANLERKTETFTDVCSIVIQHEIDHLDGIVFIDHLSRLKKSSAISKVKKFKKQRALL